MTIRCTRSTRGSNKNIGYVPQDDIIHRDLTIHQALTYVARLRLPPDVNAEDLNHVIDDTLEALDLTHRRQVKIGMLSGGQRKRVSVGVELLSRPGVNFLDEPTSGLDPGTESKLMKLFRRLADQGRTIVCATHAMENFDLFHKIVVLAPGGRLAYFGRPQKAKAFFGIEKICDLYDRMEEQIPEGWQAQYCQSKPFAEHVAPVEEVLLDDHLFAPSERGGVSPLALGRQPVRSAGEEPGALRHPAQRESAEGMSAQRNQSLDIVFGLCQCGTLIGRLARLQ